MEEGALKAVCVLCVVNQVVVVRVWVLRPSVVGLGSQLWDSQMKAAAVAEMSKLLFQCSG